MKTAVLVLVLVLGTTISSQSFSTLRSQVASVHTSWLAVNGLPDGGAARHANLGLVGRRSSMLSEELMSVGVTVSNGIGAGSHNRKSGSSESSLHLELS